MPRGDGTGPQGQGPGSGGGRGQGRGGGRGRGGGSGLGAGGYCVCPKCGTKEPHQRGIPCFEQKCARCGASMVRE